MIQGLVMQTGKFYYQVQTSVDSVGRDIDDMGIPMADAMRSNGKIYVVVAVMLIIFAGIAIYLILIEKKLKKLRDEIEDAKSS